MPRELQIFLRRKYIKRKLSMCMSYWPIDEEASTPPPGWTGWPGNKRFALIFTHDVETEKGQEKCRDLLELNERFGFKTSFNFIAEKYKVSMELIRYLKSNGCEVGIHGLYHDGKLYKSRMEFMRRAQQINSYLKEWGCVGFRSPSMHSNLEWIHDLHIEYDSSTFDTDPFEPQSEGVGTIFPFAVSSKASGSSGYIELPYTLPQDSTLFVLMQEKNIDIWKRKLDWIVKHGGMALFTTHPDYMNFNGERLSIDEYPCNYYEEILAYIKSKYEGQYWTALPRDVARFWAGRYLNNKKY
jgi:hypothetical protein